MIPGHWEPYHRLEDMELVGYLVPDGEQVVPVTLVGTPLAEPSDRFAAEQELEAVGLSYLAEPWLLRHDDGSEQRVVVVEVDPERVVVANADFALVVGAPRDIGDRVELPNPTDRLRPAR
ncbi:hypothetical protein ACHAAC_07095 [Aeromicrobium sp. CF4.19]|uniref:hypothetical protein n=1 Tax=Aeromicrobium sp. CF4.19 TaxID=3373082 RepID=UPI003EE80681